jgi:hypothetical protein
MRAGVVACGRARAGSLGNGRVGWSYSESWRRQVLMVLEVGWLASPHHVAGDGASGESERWKVGEPMMGWHERGSPWVMWDEDGGRCGMA